MKGIKLKKGKNILKKYQQSHHWTLEEYLENDFQIQFYHKGLDFRYETNFNWSRPFEYVTKHLKDLFVYENIGIRTLVGMIESNYKEFMKDGKVISLD